MGHTSVKNLFIGDKAIEYEAVDQCICGGDLDVGPIWGWGICTQCSSWINTLRPRSSCLSDLYGMHYWYDVQKSASCPTIEERFHSDISDRIPVLMDVITKFPLPGKRVLEIGCGSGCLLDQLRRRGYEVVGTELSPDVCEGVRKRTGLTIIQGGLEEVSIGNYDLIILIDVFEHLYQPVEFLSKCRSILSKGGSMLIHTPLIKDKNEPLSYAVGLLWKDFHLFLCSKALFKMIVEKSGFTSLTEHSELFGWPICEIRG